MVISAKVISDSIAGGVRLTTLQLEYPRFIHSEFMTHRMFSRNSSSSRAIPIAKMVRQVRYSPAKPIHWGKNEPGMQASQIIDAAINADDTWCKAASAAAGYAEYMAEQGLHKQVVNRVLEPFQVMHTVVTATEWDNFFALRLHSDAQPEIQELAKVMKAAMDESSPRVLVPGEWHLPYVNEEIPFGAFFAEVDIGNAGLISAARCARVSYLNHDQSEPDIEKDLALAKKLLAAGHMSPFEHQAKPLWNTSPHAHGVTHFDPRDESLWSGNFRSWIQHRQIL
jgi:thymidylate synthase ThyX